MTLTDQIQLIRDAYAALPPMHTGFTTEAEKLYRICEESEHQHRRGAQFARRFGITVDVAAQLFTVKCIADGLTGPTYKPEDLLRTRLEFVYGQGVARKYRHEIRAAWKAAGIKLADLQLVDYAELMK